MLEILKYIVEILKDISAEYIFDAILKIFFFVIPFIGKLIKSQYEKSHTVPELYRSGKGDTFFIKIFMAEIIFFMVEIAVNMVFASQILMHFNIKSPEWILMGLVCCLSVVASIIFAGVVRKRVISVKARITNRDRRENNMVFYIYLVVLNLWLVNYCFFHLGILSCILQVVAIVLEIYGLFFFQDGYIVYEHSNMILYMKNGDIVECECKNVMRTYHKGKYLVIRDGSETLHIEADGISMIKYYGNPIIELNEPLIIKITGKLKERIKAKWSIWVDKFAEIKKKLKIKKETEKG